MKNPPKADKPQKIFPCGLASAQNRKIKSLTGKFLCQSQNTFPVSCRSRKTEKKLRIAEKFFADIIISTTATGCGRKGKGQKGLTMDDCRWMIEKKGNRR
jgi:hypothetical protein